MNSALTANPPGVPPGIPQRSLVELFAKIGIGPGQDVELQSPATLRGLDRAAVDGNRLLPQMATSRGRQINGWTYPPLDIGRAGQAGDYITRAAVQPLGGIVANDPIESVYLNVSVDAAGNPLGSGQYSITFDAGANPPATFPPVIDDDFGFWSITVYDAATFNFVDGATTYTVNSHDPQYQKQLPNGGIKILLQPKQPTLSTGVYWIQTPSSGNWYAILRVYAPAPSVSGSQTRVPPAIVSLGS